MVLQVEGRRRRGWRNLILAVIGISLIWLVLLPSLSRLAWIRDRTQYLEDQGVQTDAMFYTELDWTPPVGAHFP